MEKADEADWNLSFFIGEAVIPEQLLGEWEQLDRLADSDVGYASQLVWLGDVSEKEPSDRPEFPTMQNWKLMLIQEKWDAVKNEISSSLYCLAEQGSIDVRWMSAFRDSFLQMVCEVMQVHGIPAPQILSTPLSGEEFERAASNLQIMTGWCGQILDRIAEFNTTEKADTVVKRAQKYILQNLDKELTRDSIANHVFVSGGYLGKLFKKEIGMNLPEYINSERMALAAKLLEQTELNITNIAMDVGFSNFPYFSTQFKRYSGLSPVEYRKQKHRSNT
jgi:two-component system response regulator YesN